MWVPIVADVWVLTVVSGRQVQARPCQVQDMRKGHFLNATEWSSVEHRGLHRPGVPECMFTAEVQLHRSLQVGGYLRGREHP